MSEENEVKTTEQQKVETKTETVQKEPVSSINDFSNNLIMENQKKMVLQIEALEKKLAEAKKREEQTINLLRQKEEQEKVRVQTDLVNKALSDYPVIPNAKEIAVNLIKNKLSFSETQQSMWEGKEVDETALKGGLEAFFKENSFLLDKAIKTNSPLINSAAKPQPGQIQHQKKDLSNIEGINEYLKNKFGVKK